jgi:PKD repeat protein
MNNGLQSHWEVGWNETANGHGVTEGGSSGSPLLDSYGRIVGTLTGGLSSCNSPNEKDYFGMFPYHWASNGTTDDQQLKPWLDPDNTGVSYLDGISNNPNAVYAEFAADADTIPVGGSIRFTDHSVGNISTYNWLFKGGYPVSFSGKEPPSVTYDTIGVFNTTLTVANEFYTHNKTLSVFVAPKVYPNPFSDCTFHIVMGKLSSDDNVNISLYDPYGREVKFYAVSENNGEKIVLNQCISGVYMLKVGKNGHTNALKIVCAR